VDTDGGRAHTAGDGDAGSYSTGYTEHLYPSPGVVAAAVVFAGFSGVALLPLGPVAAGVAGVLTVVVVATLLVRASVPVAVRDGVFVAGPARLPLAVVGEVEPLDAAAMRHARGPGLDARAYLCLRGWVPGGVRVHLRDPEDPVPYWLVSSRRPASLAAALTAAATSAREE